MDSSKSKKGAAPRQTFVSGLSSLQKGGQSRTGASGGVANRQLADGPSTRYDTGSRVYGFLGAWPGGQVPKGDKGGGTQGIECSEPKSSKGGSKSNSKGGGKDSKGNGAPKTPKMPKGSKGKSNDNVKPPSKVAKGTVVKAPRPPPRRDMKQKMQRSGYKGFLASYDDDSFSAIGDTFAANATQASPSNATTAKVGTSNATAIPVLSRPVATSNSTNSTNFTHGQWGKDVLAGARGGMRRRQLRRRG